MLAKRKIIGKISNQENKMKLQKARLCDKRKNKNATNHHLQAHFIINLSRETFTRFGNEEK